MHPQTLTGLPFKFTPELPGFQLTSSKGAIFLVTEPGVFGRTPNACDHGESLGSTVQKRCLMVYVTSWLRTRERDFFPCVPEQSVSRLVLNKESLQPSDSWHLLKFHILASEQVPKAPACKADRTAQDAIPTGNGDL